MADVQLKGLMASGAVKLTRAKIIHLNSYERARTIVHSADSTVPCFSQRREGGGLKITFKVVNYCAYCLHMVLLLQSNAFYYMRSSIAAGVTSNDMIYMYVYRDHIILSSL